MKNRIEDLRDHLFETIERLKNPDEKNPMDISTAKAIADVADKIIDSAKVEVEHLRALDALGVRVQTNSDGSVGTGFINNPGHKLKALK